MPLAWRRRCRAVGRIPVGRDHTTRLRPAATEALTRVLGLFIGAIAVVFIATAVGHWLHNASTDHVPAGLTGSVPIAPQSLCSLSMRVLAACSLGGAGHFNPLVPFLAAATRAGHETLVVAPASLNDMVAAAGFDSWPGSEPSEAEIARIREQLPVHPPAEASVLGNRELFGRLAARALLPTMNRACQEWAPDLVLREPCEYSSASVARQAGTPSAQVAISLADGELGSIDAAAPALEDLQVGLAEELRSSSYLTHFPASLDPSLFPTTVRYHQPVDQKPRPLPGWWDMADAPLVYMTFGTVLGYMSMATAVYRTALKAVDGLEARVLLTVGRQFDPATLEPLPSNVHVERWVDQGQVLGDARVVVCHGGSGTSFGALAAGVPLVVVPSFADQFDNGRRIAQAGAARMVVGRPAGIAGVRQPIGDDDVPRIRAAIDDVLSKDSYRREAVLLAAEMAGAPTVDEVLADLLHGVARNT